MNRRLCLFALLLIPAVAVSTLRAADEPGFVQLFDGKTLDGWEGNPELWSVKDGVINGQTSDEKPIEANTFLIWRKGQVGDFELRAEFKIDGGNSGIQYRSAEIPDSKWGISGYQADFDDKNVHTGGLYEEKGRGILAKRGTKVKIPAGGKPEVVGATTDAQKIADSVKLKDWNEIVVIAEGNHLIQKINGNVTVDVVDEDMEKGKKSGLLALQVHKGPAMNVQFRNLRIKQAGKQSQVGGETKFRLAARAKVLADPKKIVFVAGLPSHPAGAHEHNAGCILLAHELEAAMPGYKTVVYRNGWPTEAGAFDGADAIVMYCDGGTKHMVVPHLAEVDVLAKKGVGIVCLHYGVEVEAGEAGQKFLDWIGGYFEANWSVNPHWTAHFTKFPDHPITRGVHPFAINDEWYYHMRFRPDMQGVTPILSDLPSPETLSRPDGHHSGNPEVRKAVGAGEPQVVAWASENSGGGRGFGFTGGHDHWNWACPDFRKVVLNAIVWTAHGEVPAGGVESPTVTMKELETNLDEGKKSAKYDREAAVTKIKEAGGTP